MSIVVQVSVTVREGDSEYVVIDYAESVMPAAPRDEGDAISQRDVDLIDLARAALQRIADDAVTTADEQIEQFRDVLARAADR